MTRCSGVGSEGVFLKSMMEQLLVGQSARAQDVRVATGSARLVLGADGRDDAAILGVTGDVDLVVASDYVRGPKFRLYELGLLAPYDLGYYLAIANLSDIAAMGAQPLGLLTVIRYPPDMAEAEFLEVVSGIRDACSACSTQNIGGDIGTAERLILSGTAIGIASKSSSLLRSGVSPGDRLFITRPTGRAGAALSYFSQRESLGQRLSHEDEAALLLSWRRPSARLAEGSALAQSASASIDTSDGLHAAVSELAARSGVGFRITREAVPIDPVVQRYAEVVGTDALSITFSGSVDFELAFTVPDRLLGHFRAAYRDAGLTAWEIGIATAEEALALVTPAGDQDLPGVPWSQQPLVVDAPSSGPADSFLENSV